MATLIFLCSLSLLAATVQASTVVEKQPALDATNVDLYQQLLGRVEHLEKSDQDQQAEIDTLRSELYAEKQRTSKLEEVIASLRSRESGTNDDDGKTQGGDSNTELRETDKTAGQ